MWWMRAFAIVLALPDTGALARLDAQPLASVWPLGGVTVFADGDGVRIHWTAASYRLKRPSCGRLDERLYAA